MLSGAKSNQYQILKLIKNVCQEKFHECKSLGRQHNERNHSGSNNSFCLYIYIYIYIYIYFVEHNRPVLSTYLLVDPFVSPYCFYRIRRELIDVFSIIVYIPSTFCPIFGHNHGGIYYKSDVTFVLHYYYVRASLPLECIAFAFKWVSISSVSS